MHEDVINCIKYIFFFFKEDLLKTNKQLYIREEIERKERREYLRQIKEKGRREKKYRCLVQIKYDVLNGSYYDEGEAVQLILSSI